MEMTLQQAYLQATATNLLYNRQRVRWQFLLDSYQGGDDFRAGAYLNRYQLETDKEYKARLRTTPLDNQCKSLISLYISFLFRTNPSRAWDAFDTNPVLADIIEDADLDGRNMNAFMKDVAIWSSVFGHCWVCVAKPDIQAVTLADELAAEVRPYLNVFTPLTVTDWRWARRPNGSYGLDYIKYVEEVNDTETIIREWTAESIQTYVLDARGSEVKSYYSEPNGIGRLPFVCVYAERSPVRGLGVSIVNDIADQQLMIANELSEVYDSIRLDSHPSLVTTENTNVNGAAAGQIITVPENMDPQLKPYVLQFQGGQISAIYTSIDHRKAMIDSMGNVGSVRATETTTRSGISIQTEFQLLNARLSSIADNLELAEEQIWQEVSAYLGLEFDGTIDYPDNFALHDIDNELDQLAKMKTLTINPMVQAEVDRRIAEILDIELLENYVVDVNAVVGDPNATQTPGPTCPPETHDVALNLKNRQAAINTANYGPMNPKVANRTFWLAKANMFGTSVGEAKTSLCGNCAAFNRTPQTLQCVADGIAAGGTPNQGAWDQIDQAQLGVCQKFDFVCAATRTCDAWVAGGPITQDQGTAQ